MTNFKARRVKVVFEFWGLQRDENGIPETIIFQDGFNTEIGLPFNPKNDYSQNIEIEINESVYKLNKGRVITEKTVLRIISLATGKELISEGIKTEGREEEIHTILFRRGKIVPFEGKNGERYNLHKYFDASQNYIYFKEDDFLTIFGTSKVGEFIKLGLTYSAISTALEETRQKYPYMNTAKLSLRSISAAEIIDETEYDIRILNEIFTGQRKKDERFNGSFKEVYSRILKDRKEKEVRQVDSLDYDIDYGILPITNIENNLNETHRNTELENLLKRIKELEDQLKKLTDENKALREENENISKELASIYSEYTKIARIKKIVDGEDDEFSAVIFPTS